MNIDLLNNKLKGLEAEDILKTIASENNYNIVFTTSFGIEDQVITDMICKHNLNIQIVSLDTGRLFSETYKVHNLSLE
ncbi:MAG: phosphoadenosine phosphosulfate reductase family protein, partial [Bacteroidales bacterium]|nr:phosphoadenosine phosphosulfate reductase family protein [Bacteroidales bacterium]